MSSGAPSQFQLPGVGAGLLGGIEEAAAFAGGFAIAPSLRPYVQGVENFAWAEHPNKRLDLILAAEVTAEDFAQYADMENEAGFSGWDTTRFKWAYDVTLTAPGTGELLNLLRRASEVPIDFEHGLRKAKLEPQWDAAIRNLRDVRIPAPDLAYMVVRGLVPDPFGYSGPTSPTDTAINDIPELQIDTLREASFSGWDRTRFEALVGRSGLAPAPGFASQAFFRGLISYDDYLTIIRKGDLRPAYANVILNGSRQILTADQYTEAALRGWILDSDLPGLTAKHGMSPADTDLLFKIKGRPITLHQIVTGLARGGKYPSSYAAVPEPYRKSLQESNIRPEWADLAYANRYTYPSAFVLRSLAQAGELGTAADVEQILHEIGWPPSLAAKVAPSWVGGTTGADPHVAKAETQLWTRAHASYIAEEIDDTASRAALTTLGIDGAAQDQILSLWQQERSLIRKQLTPAQLKKAWKGSVVNPATGAAWTRDEAMTELVDRGYSAEDATVFLDL